MVHIGKKYGPEMVRRFSAEGNPLDVAGQKVGIRFNSNRKIIPTMRCHVVMEHVNSSYGIVKGNELMQVLFRRYFEEAQNVNQPNILLEACIEVFGEAHREEFQEMMANEAKLASQVATKDRLAKTQYRVNGVPFFRIGKNSFSGAQPSELIAEVLEEAASDSA